MHMVCVCVCVCVGGVYVCESVYVEWIVGDVCVSVCVLCECVQMWIAGGCVWCVRCNGYTCVCVHGADVRALDSGFCMSRCVWYVRCAEYFVRINSTISKPILLISSGGKKCPADLLEGHSGLIPGSFSHQFEILKV